MQAGNTTKNKLKKSALFGISRFTYKLQGERQKGGNSINTKMIY